VRISKEIQKKLYKLAEHNIVARNLSKEIDEYLIKKGIDVEELRNPTGYTELTFDFSDIDYGCSPRTVDQFLQAAHENKLPKINKKAYSP